MPRRSAAIGIGSARQHSIVCRFADLRAHQRLSEKMVQDIGSRFPKVTCSRTLTRPKSMLSWPRPRPISPAAQANVKLAGFTAQRHQGLLKSVPVSKQDLDNYNRDYTASRPWCSPLPRTWDAWKNWNPSARLRSVFRRDHQAQRRYRHAHQCRKRRHLRARNFDLARPIRSMSTWMFRRPTSTSRPCRHESLPRAR